MSTTVRREAVVGPDGKIEISVPELQPGQRVTVTIQAEQPTPASHPIAQPYSARDLLRLPREERERILAAAAELAASAYEQERDSWGR